MLHEPLRVDAVDRKFSVIVYTTSIITKMSKATKRKHVTKEILEEYYVPEEGEEIVKILAGRGNNLHEVVSADGKKFLVSMPTKFRKNVWVKRGDFVIVSYISEGVKVQGEIVYILFNKQIKYLKDENLWPEEFTEKEETKKDIQVDNDSKERICSKSEESEDDDFDDELFVNPNHRHVIYQENSTDDDSSTENESESDNDDHVMNEQMKNLET